MKKGKCANSSKIIHQLELMFNTFNKKFFRGSLDPVWFDINNKTEKGCVNYSEMIDVEHNNMYKVSIPSGIANGDIYTIAACVLRNMINIYDYVNNYNMTSNNGQYCNKKFRNFARDCGVDITPRGICTGYSDEFIKFCKNSGFKKTWKKVYRSPSRGSGSSRVYTDKLGNKVRTTKEHVILLLDGLPSSIIKRLEVEAGRNIMWECKRY